MAITINTLNSEYIRYAQEQAVLARQAKLFKEQQERANKNIVRDFLECPLFLKTNPTGSRYICNPAPMDTDEDHVCLTTPMDWDECLAWLDDRNYKTHTKHEQYSVGDGEFISLRKGVLNLIVTDDDEFYNKFVEATRLAKERNLLRKQDRIRLFNEVFGKNTEIKIKKTTSHVDLMNSSYSTTFNQYVNIIDDYTTW